MFKAPKSEFVYYRTYSRWLEELGRREIWPETVDRVVNFIKKTRGEKIPPKVLKKLKKYMLEFEVMPSMRLLWAAGPAAEEHNVTIFNCSFMFVDSVVAFAEALYILMCGTGSGYRTIRVDAEALPSVPLYPKSGLRLEKNQILDSKEGWSDSVILLLDALYKGFDIEFDYSLIRPKGARLKTMGGRASGPEPLIKLHAFIRETFMEAQGRKLNTLEISDIMNEVAEIVVVGGVRRSSEISLSELDDELMRHAKDWPFPTRRNMSNNSAIYYKKPSAVEFLKEWTALAASGTGERGIFNLEAAVKCAPKRRNATLIAGTNPCKPLNSLILTTEGYITFKQALAKPYLDVVTNNGIRRASTPFLTKKNAQVYRVLLSNGSYLYGTEDHKHMTSDGKWIEMKNLEIGMHLKFNNKPIFDTTVRNTSSYEDGLVAGWVHGDGWWRKRGDSKGDTVGMCFGIHEMDVVQLFEDILNVKTKPHEQKPNTCRYFSSHKKELSEKLENAGMLMDKNDLTWLYGKDRDFKLGFIRALFTADGSVRKQNNVELYSCRRKALDVISHILREFGIYNTICIHNNAKSYMAKDEKLRNNKTSYKINVYAGQFKKIGFISEFKNKLLEKQEERPIYRYIDYVSVVDIEAEYSVEDVYDITVMDNDHAFIDSGVITHNCGEIMLRNMEFCNLSSVIVRPYDDLDSLLDKVETATWIGTIQASYTDFKYLRPEWKANCEEEALLGVSLCGQADNQAALTADALRAMKARAIRVNKKAAATLGINPAAAVTCGKPDGTTSQFVDAGSGCHPWYAQYFIRRYRISGNDPLFKMMRDQGVKFTPENGQTVENASTWVVEFPDKAPEGALLREHTTALSQLEWYKHMQLNWCEHNQSITIYVKDHEWLEVGNWVYQNWDIVNGVSFLPYDGGHYDQAPYEEITKERYEDMLVKFPKIDYNLLGLYETEDSTTGAQTYACVGGKCEI